MFRAARNLIKLLLCSNLVQSLGPWLFLLSDSQLAVSVGAAGHQRELVSKHKAVVLSTAYLEKILLRIDGIYLEWVYALHLCTTVPELALGCKTPRGTEILLSLLLQVLCRLLLVLQKLLHLLNY